MQRGSSRHWGRRRSHCLIELLELFQSHLICLQDTYIVRMKFHVLSSFIHGSVNGAGRRHCKAWLLNSILTRLTCLGYLTIRLTIRRVWSNNSWLWQLVSLVYMVERPVWEGQIGLSRFLHVNSNGILLELFLTVEIYSVSAFSCPTPSMVHQEGKHCWSFDIVFRDSRWVSLLRPEFLHPFSLMRMTWFTLYTNLAWEKEIWKGRPTGLMDFVHAGCRKQYTIVTAARVPISPTHQWNARPTFSN